MLAYAQMLKVCGKEEMGTTLPKDLSFLRVLKIVGETTVDCVGSKSPKERSGEQTFPPTIKGSNVCLLNVLCRHLE